MIKHEHSLNSLFAEKLPACIIASFESNFNVEMLVVQRPSFRQRLIPLPQPGRGAVSLTSEPLIMRPSSLDDDIVHRAAALAAADGAEPTGEIIDEAILANTVSATRALQILFRNTDDDSATRSSAAVALALQGVPGLQALREAAIDPPRVKTSTAFFFVMAGIAAGTLSHLRNPLHNPRADITARLIDLLTRAPEMRTAARQQLVDYILDSDDFGRFRFGQALMMLSTGVALEPSAADTFNELIAAAGARWLAVSESRLRDFDDLIVSKPNDEPIFHRFFEEYPALLDPLAAEVWSKPDLHGRWEADFVLRRFDDSYVIVEIEVPSKRIYTSHQPSAQLTHAMQQARDYQTYLDEHLAEARQRFPRYALGSECLVIIGLEYELDDNQKDRLARLISQQNRVAIMGFDAITRRARTVRTNLFSRLSITLKTRL